MGASLYKLLFLLYCTLVFVVRRYTRNCGSSMSHAIALQGPAVATEKSRPHGFYKRFVTSRGYDYHYYRVAASYRKPTIVFLHGWPSTSYDWHQMTAHFKARGYGIIAPDMLGYGGTSKPTDPAAYRHILVAKDIVEILDAEQLDQVIGVGHDWCAFQHASAVCT